MMSNRISNVESVAYIRILLGMCVGHFGGSVMSNRISNVGSVMSNPLGTMSDQ